MQKIIQHFHLFLRLPLHTKGVHFYNYAYVSVVLVYSLSLFFTEVNGWLTQGKLCCRWFLNWYHLYTAYCVFLSIPLLFSGHKERFPYLASDVFGVLAVDWECFGYKERFFAVVSSLHFQQLVKPQAFKTIFLRILHTKFLQKDFLWSYSIILQFQVAPYNLYNIYHKSIHPLGENRNQKYSTSGIISAV